jgi:replicative DNA helicase
VGTFDVMDIKDLDISKYQDIKLGRIFNFSQMEDSYIEYAKNIQGRKVSLAIPSLDRLLGMVRPSQVVTFVGSTNVGKTGMAMNVCFHNAEILKDSLIILIECEIDENEIYERALQMEFDLYTYQVEQAYQKNNTELINQFKSIKLKYRNIISIIHRVDTEEIVPYIKSIEDLYEKKCGLLIIDYVGLVKNKYHDEYDRVTYSMQKLKEIALHLQIPVINLSQTSRADVKDNKKGLSLYSGKSSGEIENSSQILITLDRITEIDELPSEVVDKCTGDKPTHYLIKATIQKKKQGDFGETYLLFNKKNLRLTDINNDLF